MTSKLASCLDRCSSVVLLINLVLVISLQPLSAFAASESTRETAAKQTNVETELAILKETSGIRADAQDKRIGDLSLAIQFYSILITLLGIGVAFAAYLTVKQKARETAEQWFNENERKLRDRIDEVEKFANQVKQKMLETAQSVEIEARTAMDRFQQGLSSGQKPAATPAERKALVVKEEALKTKPEREYTAEDWNSRAFAAYAEGKFALAAEYFDEAAKSPGVERVKQTRFIVNRGFLFSMLGRNDEALAVYNDVVARYGSAPEIELRVGVAMALFNKGVILGQLNRHDEAVIVYDEVVSRYGNAPEAALREQVARALVNRGSVFAQLNRHDEAVVVYDEVVSRYGNAPEAALREQVARALVNRGLVFAQLNRHDEAVVVYDEVVSRYGNAPEAALREQVARALVNRGLVLAQLNRHDEALAVYNDVVSRYGNAPEAALREQVAMALVGKGVNFQKLGRYDEAITAHNEVVSRYGNAQEVNVRGIVGAALNGKGYDLLCRAKANWGNEAERLADLRMAAELFVRAATEMDSNKYLALGNQSYTAFLLGQTGEVRSLLAQALKEGGEVLYKETLDDLAIHPVPLDTDFRTVLEDVWGGVAPTRF